MEHGGAERPRVARRLWWGALALALAVPPIQWVWVFWDDAGSWLPGDARSVALWVVLLGLPGIGGALAAVRWPRLGGAVAGLWLVPRLLWFGDPHLEIEALWALAGVVWVVLAVLGVRWRRGVVAWPLLAALGALWAGWPAQATRSATVVGDSAPCEVAGASSGPGAPLVVLITLDTVRADHLGAIGGARFLPRTPALDGLAARGTLFTEGVAPTPLTGPSHTALLTGCDPLTLGVLRNGVAVPEQAPRVAERLQRQGYRTGAFVASSVLDRRAGLGRGFDHYDDRFDVWHRLRATWPRRLFGRLGWLPPRRQRPGQQVVDRALRWLEGGDGPTFLWVHLYDAHHPYDPAPAWLEAVSDTDPDGQGTAADVGAWKAWAKEHHRVRGLPEPGRAKDLSDRLRSYAAEVAEVDDLVGQLLAGLPADAAVLVASDHGESLTEHGYVLNHGAHAYQPTLRVPFLAVGPGFDAARVERPTPSTRVAGTLLRWGGLDAAGLDVPYDVEAEGPIESYAAGQEARRRVRLARGSPELSIREGATKWLIRREQVWRLDLATDPQERDPVPIAGPELQERMRAIEEGGQPVAEGLEALGYVD